MLSPSAFAACQVWPNGLRRQSQGLQAVACKTPSLFVCFFPAEDDVVCEPVNDPPKCGGLGHSSHEVAKHAEGLPSDVGPSKYKTQGAFDSRIYPSSLPAVPRSFQCSACSCLAFLRRQRPFPPPESAKPHAFNAATPQKAS